TPSPRAAEALCSRLAELLGAEVDLSELADAGREYVEQVTEAVASDSDTQAYVESLEQQVDALEAEANLPSGDSIAAELTRFLRDQDERTAGEDALDPDLPLPGVREAVLRQRLREHVRREVLLDDARAVVAYEAPEAEIRLRRRRLARRRVGDEPCATPVRREEPPDQRLGL